jgi:predicted phage-related endonuclease
MRLVMTAAEVDADEDKWLLARRDLITASKVGVLMKLEGAHLTGEFAQGPASLWMEMTGRIDPTTVRRLPPRHVLFGKYCENWTAWEVAEMRPDLHVTPGGLYVDDEEPWIGATFDRLAHDRAACGGDGCSLVPPGYTIQMKTEVVRNYEQTGIPLAYWAQCLWEAQLARARYAYLAVLDKATNEVKIFAIEMGPDTARELDLMMTAAADFMDLVRTDTRPPIDWLPATTEALYQLHPNVDKHQVARIPLWLWRAWRRAAQRRDAAEKRRNLYKNMIIDRIGGAGQIAIRHPATGQIVVVGWQRSSPRAGYTVPASSHDIRSITPSTKKDLPL